MLINFNPSSVQESRTKRKTRIEILSTAYALFAAHGFFATSVVEIAHAARVTRRTFYNYYPAKEDLIRELHPLVVSSLCDTVYQEWVHTGGEESGLMNYMNVLYSSIVSDQEMVRYMVKFDRFSSARRNIVEDDYILDRYLLQHTPILHLLGDSAEAPADSRMLARVIIHSFIAFLSRFTYRAESFRQEGINKNDQFTFYHDCLAKSINGRVYA
ncbi:MAG: TetR/AcrR family transcriptional regulator [Spirochaetales bacterium]|nr:TetR/AcrR family transcriptional regulator [Spirochaetales bacterium]